MSRMPAVAGRFYPGQRQELQRVVEAYSRSPGGKCSAIGVVVPHAGFIYSGAIAGATFGRVQIPQRVVILGPNHHGLGHPVAVYAKGSWQTPLGSVAVDETLAQAILGGCPDLAADETAHKFEHSLEVQLPFIQVLAPQAGIVPICLGRIGLTETLRLGNDLGRVLAQYPGETLIVASSDMTHYEPGPVARKKDLRALQQIQDLDPSGLYQTVYSESISMCGVIPVVVMLSAALRLGAQSVELIHYGNSGDVTGDQAEVVGYAGVVVA
ncbi:MAG: AmmeMemoRadiSam system protein B [Desulfuromonadaceae bacterium]